MSNDATVIDLASERAARGLPAHRALPLTPEDARLIEVDARALRCRHAQVQVSASERTVSCAECKAALDPIEVLLFYAHEERKFTWTQESLRRQKRDLEEKIEGLEKKKKSLQASVRRLEKT